MYNKVYLDNTHHKIMPYNQLTVVIGGLMHIPVIILVLRFIENRFKKNEIEYQKN
tara:strand:- start:370 stop:534 length:165 start_codon:yes stop_codon:yes gene_type:complete